MTDSEPKVRLINEKELEGFDGKMPSAPTIYFKIVSIGENTLTETEHNPDKVLQKVREQPGFVLVGENPQDVCDSMHQIVMQLHEAWTGESDESKSKTQE